MARTKGKLTEQQALPGTEDEAGEAGEAAGTDSGASNVRRLRGGRPSGLGYDPTTGQEHRHVGRAHPEVDFSAFIDPGKGYRSDRFYTRSSDNQGHDVQMRVRVPKGLDSQIHAAVAEVPEYRTPHDFIRDAILHRLEWIQTHYAMSPAARRMLEVERFNADITANENEMQMMTGSIEAMTAMLTLAAGTKDWSMFQQTLEYGEEVCEWLREPYKGKAEGILAEWKRQVKEEIQSWERKRKMGRGGNED